MLRIGSADMGNYLETFLSVLCYFLLVIFEVMYVGLVHYSFVTLRRNFYQLILEHVNNNNGVDNSNGMSNIIYVVNENG